MFITELCRVLLPPANLSAVKQSFHPQVLFLSCSSQEGVPCSCAGLWVRLCPQNAPCAWGGSARCECGLCPRAGHRADSLWNMVLSLGKAPHPIPRVLNDFLCGLCWVVVACVPCPCGFCSCHTSQHLFRPFFSQPQCSCFPQLGFTHLTIPLLLNVPGRLKVPGLEWASPKPPCCQRRRPRHGWGLGRALKCGTDPGGVTRALPAPCLPALPCQHRACPASTVPASTAPQGCSGAAGNHRARGRRDPRQWRRRRRRNFFS